MAERCRTCSRVGMLRRDREALGRRGFSLLGLLILIAILGIVSASSV